MKWLTIPINLPEFSELLRQAQIFQFSEPNVIPLDDRKKKKKDKPFVDRNTPRPWSLIPSVKDFRIELSPYDWLLALFKLKKKFKPQLTFTQWKNDGSNLYIDYMFKKLRLLVESEQYDRAQETMWKLMNSSVYQVCGLNHVLKNWHRNLSYKQVKWILRDVKKLVKNKATAIKYARVYLDEPTKIRPLGVPAISWRIYLHMYNNCLVEWRMVTESNKQHGYLPQKGVITAWFELSKRLSSPNIFEADYKGFFNNVTHYAISKEMEELGFPTSECLFVWSLNNSVVKLTKKDRIEEPHRPFVDKEPVLTTTQGVLDKIPFKNRYKKKVLGFSKWKNMDNDLPMKGVPQGAPTSCSVATLVLRWIEERFDVIIYADDIIYFPTSSDCDPVVDLSNVEKGLIVNESKSRWLKKDGIWLVDSFKFLGITYFTPRLRKSISAWIVQRIPSLSNILRLIIPTDLNLHGGKFVANTRKGANLEFSQRESFISYLATARNIVLDSDYLMHHLQNYTLQRWLSEKEIQWRNIFQNKAKILFHETYRHIMKDPDGKLLPDEKVVVYKKGVSDEQTTDLWISAITNSEIHMSTPEIHLKHKGLFEAWKEIHRKIVDEGAFVIKRYRNPLAGYFVAGMFNNSWTKKVKQSFGLSYISQSWIGERWGLYSWEWILPRNELNIFIASSFACHDLIEYASGLSVVNKDKSVIRRVSSRNPEGNTTPLPADLLLYRAKYRRALYQRSGRMSKFLPA